MKVAGVILAAGESRRMGSPKALLAYQGQSFLDCLIGLFLRQCSPVIVVLGYRPEVILRGSRLASQVRWVVNADYQLGQLSSLQAGLRAVPARAGFVLFTPVDHPAVSAETVGAVASQAGAAVVVPRFEGRNGHPVRIDRKVVNELLSLDSGGSARTVLRAHARVFIETQDAGVVADIDDPEAYRQLLERGA